MRVDPDGTVVLSRRNLLSLIAKLDGFPAHSVCTIIGGDEAPGLVVKAEEDERHYLMRPAGPMHYATELRLMEGGEDMTTKPI